MCIYINIHIIYICIYMYMHTVSVYKSIALIAHVQCSSGAGEIDRVETPMLWQATCTDVLPMDSHVDRYMRR